MIEQKEPNDDQQVQSINVFPNYSVKKKQAKLE